MAPLGPLGVWPTTLFTAPPAVTGHGYARQTETLIDGNIVKQSADGGETCFAFGAAEFRQRSPWYMEASK